MNATFWAGAGLVLFFVVLFYFKVPRRIAGALDDRSAQIARELEEARDMRDEAQKLLAEYQRKLVDAQKEAEQIIADAERTAARAADETAAAMDAMIARQMAAAEVKIERAIAGARADIEAHAAGIALDVAREIITEQMSESLDRQLAENGVDTVRTYLGQARAAAPGNV